ncbi:TIGR01777 family oxidoreductase [Macrococcoides bohemicum]|uniref:TIGR01777 family oxidoreductase n=1 Tax=Macrococcoides bohemicum TaxID=1903056 RepID=UPI000BB544E9|nr:TIGR01777 family oxidoreductase [Macrococcus sp. IME1552]ATD31493.1 TIGR01777 family protein [Macrococcus sp. IME1552]
MNILITGGTGLVGSALINTIQQKYKHAHIYITTRSDKQSSNGISYISWKKDDWYKAVPQLDLVVNLAGASLNKRWTKEHKETIIKSRIESTEKLIPLFESLNKKPFFISASAVGYYPAAKSLTYDETNTFLPFDFLSKTVYLWEQTARKIESLGVETAICRFGIVFSNQGGALPLMIKPYQFFAGGNIGDGQQPYSWIHIEDLAESMLYIFDKQLTGIFNMTSPQPVTQQQLGTVIARVIHRPHWTKVPNKVMDIVLGEQSIMVTKGQSVLPHHLLQAGYTFKYPNVQLALEQLYGE